LPETEFRAERAHFNRERREELAQSLLTNVTNYRLQLMGQTDFSFVYQYLTVEQLRWGSWAGPL
jgi:hypothetical protein